MNSVFTYDYSTDTYTDLAPDFLQDLTAGNLQVSSKILGLPVLVINDNEFILHKRINNRWIECDDPFYTSSIYKENGIVKGIWTLNKYAKSYIAPIEDVKNGKYFLVGPTIDYNIYCIDTMIDRNYLVPFNAFPLLDLEPLTSIEKPLDYIRWYIVKANIAGVVYYNDFKAYSVTRETIDVYIDYPYEKLSLTKIKD